MASGLLEGCMYRGQLESIEKDIELTDWLVESPDWLEFGAISRYPAKTKKKQIVGRRRKENSYEKQIEVESE